MKLPAEFYNRPTSTNRLVQAGCFACNGSEAIWTHAGAQGTAAKHHDTTQHETWCDVVLSIRYGHTAPNPDQIDIEDAIASASSGGAPETASLTDFDASTVAAADVSAPTGRSSNPALAAAQPEHANV